MKHLLAAILLIGYFISDSAADDAVVLQDHEGVRVWYGTELKASRLKSPDGITPLTSEDKTLNGSANTQESNNPIVNIADQPPLHRAGYHIRCKLRSVSSCPLSEVVVDVSNQPAIRRVRGLPSTQIWISTESRDGVLYAVAQVVRRGVPVHQTGMPDDWRITIHRAGESSDQYIPVIRAGTSTNQNIAVKRAGVSNSWNIRVKRAGVSNNQDIRVHRAGVSNNPIIRAQ